MPNSPFHPPPYLKGKLIELKPLSADDFNDLFQVAGDPLIWQQHPVKNRHEPDSFAAYFQDSLDAGSALVVRDLTTDQVIGSSRYHGYLADSSEVEIGWSFLARTHWGGVFNGEMKALMLRYAFKHVGRVILLVGLENQRSQRAVEKIGGRQVGTRPDTGGNDSMIYEIRKHDFQF